MARTKASVKRWYLQASDEEICDYLKEASSESLAGKLPFSWYEATLEAIRAEIQRRVSKRARVGSPREL